MPHFNLSYLQMLGLTVFLWINSIAIQAQSTFEFTVDTIRLPDWPALHSFSFGVYQDKVYIFGGRMDGIHEKESGFQKSGANEKLYVWNTLSNHISNYDLSILPDSILLPLSATGTSFVQNENQLVIIGGYGQSESGIYDTYPSLIHIDLEILDQVVNNQGVYADAIKQISNSKFRTAGAQLQYLDGKYYLVGGNLFEGEYKSNSGQVKQQYSETATIFSLIKGANSLNVNFEFEYRDEFNFHRRDYNMVPFVVAPGLVKLMIFSGVFLINENRPFMNIALLDKNGYEDVLNFNQRFAHYHCSKVGVYSFSASEMSEIFFGGMAEYFIDSTGISARDPLVPFVSTISKVSKLNDGSYKESFYANQMPGFLGTNSEFLIHRDIPLYAPGIVDLDKIKNDTVFLGTIFGGIYNPTTDPNPWQNNKAHLTKANPYLLKVHVIKNANPNSSKWIQKHSPNKALFRVSPNPAKDKCLLNIDGLTWSQLSVWLIDPNGKLLFYNNYSDHTLPVIHINPYPKGAYIIYAIADNKYFFKSEVIKQ